MEYDADADCRLSPSLSHQDSKYDDTDDNQVPKEVVMTLNQ